jgi:hypothetical protein
MVNTIIVVRKSVKKIVTDRHKIICYFREYPSNETIL